MPHHLIDVRSPAEFSSLPPHAPLPGAINIEFTSIGSLSSVVPSVARDDDITLYCRSGRRSAIALEELRSLGFAKARDIGGLEAARATWEAERNQRLAGYAGQEKGCGAQSHGHAHDHGKVEEIGFGPDRESLERSHRALLEGLREAE